MQELKDSGVQGGCLNVTRYNGRKGTKKEGNQLYREQGTEGTRYKGNKVQREQGTKGTLF